MENNYISCKEYAESIKFSLKNNLEYPTLLIIQVGDNQASNSYIKGKINDCKEVGIIPLHMKLEEIITEEELIEYINKANNDNTIKSIIVQLPLPKHINVKNIQLAINPNKDVDGFHPLSPYIPCTPLGIVSYLKANNIELKGKHVVILGRSNIVGKPMAKLILQENATVTICHSYTTNLKFYTQNADIIISAIGKPKFITREYIDKNKPIIIDVGINRDENGKLCGDVDYDSVEKYCELITPVPNGVGLLTRCALLENVKK